MMTGRIFSFDFGSGFGLGLCHIVSILRQDQDKISQFSAAFRMRRKSLLNSVTFCMGGKEEGRIEQCHLSL